MPGTGLSFNAGRWRDRRNGRTAFLHTLHPGSLHPGFVVFHVERTIAARVSTRRTCRRRQGDAQRLERVTIKPRHDPARSPALVALEPLQADAGTPVSFEQKLDTAVLECADQQIFRTAVQRVTMAFEVLDRAPRYAGDGCEAFLGPIEKTTRRAALLRK
jgi:hypothetical protein